MRNQNEYSRVLKVIEGIINSTGGALSIDSQSKIKFIVDDSDISIYQRYILELMYFIKGEAVDNTMKYEAAQAITKTLHGLVNQDATNYTNAEVRFVPAILQIIEHNRNSNNQTWNLQYLEFFAEIWSMQNKNQ